MGISFQLNGCKPIIITRQKLGHDIPLSPEVELIAVAVARECAGLPLGIITMAETWGEWRNTDVVESAIMSDSEQLGVDLS